MSVITEAALRVLLKDEDLSALQEYRVEPDVIVTPSARAYLTDHKIDLIIGDKCVIRNPAPPEEKAPPPRPAPAPAADNGALPAFEKPGRYESVSGGFYTEKPEHMTALTGNILVEKDHKRIRFRGRLDSLEAQILETQVAFRRLGLEKGVADLEETLGCAKEMLRSEVLGARMPAMQLLGLSEDELREHSHNPKKYYGIHHFATSVDDGEAVVRLNSLRCAVREVEIAAYEAFKKETGEPDHPGILQALNRLSSVFYIMMFKAKTKEYEP